MQNLPTYAELLAALHLCNGALRLGSDINSQYEARKSVRALLSQVANNDCMKPAGASPVNLHETADAHVWAAEYCRINAGADHATMLGWFANSIMAGYDLAERKARAAPAA
jgi:hypothetical protein